MEERVSHKIGRYAIAAGDRIVNIAILIVILLMLLYGTYALWDDYSIVKAADPSNYTGYSPAVSPLKFADFAAKNPDVIGWLTIPDTNIDYPLVQGDDLYYLNHSAMREESLSGSLFLTQENSPGFSDFNSIIYGHHMAEGRMFGDLDKFMDGTFFDAHPNARIYYDASRKKGEGYSPDGSWAWHTVSLAAIVECRGDDTVWYSPGMTDSALKETFLSGVSSDAVHYRDIGAAPGDHMIELSTCQTSDSNGRTILIGRIEQ